MTCKFKPTPQPKRETTLERLTRQMRAIVKLVDAHNKAVNREDMRLETAINRAHQAGESATARQNRLEALQEETQDLILGANED